MRGLGGCMRGGGGVERVCWFLGMLFVGVRGGEGGRGVYESV